MRGLKALVIGMGVLIVAGVVVLVIGIVQKWGEKNQIAPSVGPAQLTLPPGARVVETRIGDGRIVLRVAFADGSGQLLILDAETGRQIRQVNLVPGGPVLKPNP